MRTIDKIVSNVNSQSGAPMGRGNRGVRPLDGTKIYDCAVPMCGYGDYDKGGAYWGIGPQLRVAYTKDLSFVRFYRIDELPQIRWSKDYKYITVNGGKVAELFFEEYSQLSSWNMVMTLQDWVKKHYVVGDVIHIYNDENKLLIVADILDDSLNVIHTTTFRFEDFQQKRNEKSSI